MSIVDEPLVARLAGNPTVRGNVGGYSKNETVGYSYTIGNSSFTARYECLIRQGRIIRRVLSYITPCCNKAALSRRNAGRLTCYKCEAVLPIEVGSLDVGSGASEANFDARLYTVVEDWLTPLLSEPLERTLDARLLAEEFWRYMWACEARLPLGKKKEPQ